MQSLKIKNIMVKLKKEKPELTIDVFIYFLHKFLHKRIKHGESGLYKYYVDLWKEYIKNNFCEPDFWIFMISLQKYLLLILHKITIFYTICYLKPPL